MIKCEFESGTKASLRHVTCDAIALKDHQILLVKRAENLLLEPSKYALPGGFVNRDETVSQAVLRELQEETGYLGKVVSLLTIVDLPDRPAEDRQNIDFVFIVEVGEKIQQPDFEVQEVQWFDLDNIPVEIAFDHGRAVELYKRYLKQKFPLPVIGENNVR